MQNPPYILFLVFAFIWIIMGVAAVIALLKADGQEIKFGKWGLIVALPIILPFVLSLIYQVTRPFIIHHLM